MSNGADLSFVNLGITIGHLENGVTVFGFRIAFYGIIIGCGMLAGIWLAKCDAIPGFCIVCDYFCDCGGQGVLCAV